MELRYSIFDPTGNITALVESEIDTARQPDAAAGLMRRRPEVEQVGFVRAAGEEGLPSLRMAGGEFCGNASMCAAALLLRQKGQSGGELRLRVSGAAEPVAVKLRREEADSYAAEILMPPALGVEARDFSFAGLRGPLSLVRMEGISHLIVEADSVFFSLLKDREAAQRAVRTFCTELGADGLGLLFLEGEGPARRMTPLVYVPGSGTVFWENSCASGSAAVGTALAVKSGAPAELSLRQPGGKLRVSSSPSGSGTRLYGKLRCLGSFSEKFSESC